MNTIWALTLPGAMNVSYMILIMNFFRGIPTEIEDAAVIDGANQLQILFRVYLPMSMPSLATIILFATVANWNCWMDGYMYMNTPDKYPPADLPGHHPDGIQEQRGNPDDPRTVDPHGKGQ